MENHMADTEQATLLVVGDDLLFSRLFFLFKEPPQETA